VGEGAALNGAAAWAGQKGELRDAKAVKTRRALALDRVTEIDGAVGQRAGEQWSPGLDTQVVTVPEVVEGAKVVLVTNAVTGGAFWTSVREPVATNMVPVVVTNFLPVFVTNLVQVPVTNLVAMPRGVLASAFLVLVLAPALSRSLRIFRERWLAAIRTGLGAPLAAYWLIGKSYCLLVP
jgi:hypothetical protein